MSKKYTYKYFDCTYEEMMYQYHEKYEKDYRLIGKRYSARPSDSLVKNIKA